MNKTTVFSKTGKGLLEIKNKSNRLSKDQFRVLNLVDGKTTFDDLVEKSRTSELELRKTLTALSNGGFIKEFTNPGAAGDYTSVTIPPVPPSASYVDDLDFTQILGPAKPARPAFYQSAQTEQKQREETDRRASEAAATKAREEAEKRTKEENARRAREEETARRIRAEAERKAKEEQSRREKLEAEMRFRLDEPKRLKDEAERKAREKAEAEQRAKDEAERKAREEVERRNKIQAEAVARVEAERKRLQDEERKRREDEERRRREEEEERKRKEDEERKRKEEEERKRKEEEERKRRDEEERRRRADEERKRQEEEERKRKEEEERKRREEEERRRREEEEERKRRAEEEERKRREEEERKRREEEERKRKEEEERKQEEERKRKEEEENKRKEEEERRRKDEAERLRRELEERHRREEEELLRRLEQGPLSEDEERKQREEAERQRQDGERQQQEEERKRKAEEDSRRRQEEERRREDDERKRQDDERKRRDEEGRARKEEDERKRRADEERKRREEEALPTISPFPSLDITAAPAPFDATDLGSDLAALRRAEAEVEKEYLAKEASIRQALEEQERRFRLEDEARTAMDRAERLAREKADEEARELAQAAERARREAEQRGREEGIRRQEEDKEKRAKEQEERKKKGEDERKKRERDRREQEQRAREEDLKKKRAEQEEADRKKSERERLARAAKKISWGPGRVALVALVVVIAVAIGGIQVAPLSAYAPEMEKMASEMIGEPVRIGGVRASMFPSFHLKLDNVTIGAQQDVRVPTITAYMDFGSVFDAQKVVKKLQVDQLQANQDVLARLPGWLRGDPAKVRKLKVRQIVLKGAKLDVKGVTLPPFDSQLFLAADGKLLSATIATVDGRFDAEVLPRDAGAADVTVRVKNFTLPLGPGIELIEGQAKGALNGNEIRLSEMEFYLYGGQGKGQAVVTWGPGWSVEGDFDIKRVELEPAMKALKIDIVSDGMLDTKGRYALQSNSVDTLFDNPRIEATFALQKGNLSAFDFVRALQSPLRDGIQGGKTKFDEMSGNLSVSGARYTYSNVHLAAGLLSASGGGEVLPTRDVNGRVYVELRSSSNLVRGTYRVTGSLKAIVLKQ